MELTQREFEQIRQLVHAAMGICLAEEKKTMVQNRLQKWVLTKGFSTYTAFLDHIRQDQSGKELVELANRISTNFTFFFREAEHFAFLKNQALPRLTKTLSEKRDTDLRVWCAACSTGEEAYTLQLSIMDFFGPDFPQWKAGILATDISDKALQTAKEGIYESEQVKLVPNHWRTAYFRILADRRYAVSDQAKREITFRHFNLMNTSFPFKKPFHVIFCRNVMMYFDTPGRQALVKKLHHWLVPGGYLFIGHSESIRGFDGPLEYCQPSVFQKVAAA